MASVDFNHKPYVRIPATAGANHFHYKGNVRFPITGATAASNRINRNRNARNRRMNNNFAAAAAE